MNNEKHSKFCKELGNSNYTLNNKTIEGQDDFLKRTLGISREKVQTMDVDEFHKLVESKSERKIGYDKNIKIDGCTPVTLEEKEEKEERE